MVEFAQFRLQRKNLEFALTVGVVMSILYFAVSPHKGDLFFRLLVSILIGAAGFLGVILIAVDTK